MQNQKGFTIIELIVVIAIIVILASIILININGYINKANDAAVKEDMSSLLADAANYYGSNGSFASVAADPDYLKATTGIGSTGLKYTLVTACDSASDCSGTSTKWCACVQEKAVTANYFCVDSSGKRTEETAKACSAECYYTSGDTKSGSCQ
jgi:prepilin-type N-terminal cleavage/methylation domain-containing protein